ncbi:hypothetical protein CAPTEDRAFT_98058 [Capitella teleta]|uniref:Crossover junction endonuclease EME1 n=1 Tax=Capitella teleta TaxID=283909 RepID=R7UL09_CAPTE|nr:hypothetical protein CAPTEDRAFT_98058 [Capitella teleta]|eukprot:ELU07229.1 hypothetical protein CAPTEDRAFT_98058 [Capitella teleta]
MDVSGSSKVTKEGRGLLSLWRQHIQQFRNVTAEVANAIIAEYPSPRDLYQAYLSCENQNKAEQLLQDIVVRRGAGVIATNRRIGKELSRKIYLLMTSCDPDLIIK